LFELFSPAVHVHVSLAPPWLFWPFQVPLFPLQCLLMLAEQSQSHTDVCLVKHNETIKHVHTTEAEVNNQFHKQQTQPITTVKHFNLVTITHHEGIDKSFDISKELVHCILLWIKAEILGYLLI